MQPRLPSLQVDADNYILLSDAFWRVGCFMFPQTWTGIEIAGSHSVETTSTDINKEHERLKLQLRRCRQTEMDLKLAVTSEMTEDEYQRHRNELEKRADATRRARAERDRFGETFDMRLSDRQAYERRKTVEERLLEAISTKELALCAVHGHLMPDGSWNEILSDPDFELSFRFSYARLPEAWGRQRMAVGFLRRNFEAWTGPYEWDLIKIRQDRLENRVVDWFRLYQAQKIDAGVPFRKKDAEAACKEFFSDLDVGSLFLSAWNLYAADALKQPGRR